MSAPAIAIAAVPEGIALIDLPGQVEIDIDTLASSFLPALSGASETRLPSRLQPLAPFSFGASVVSLPLIALSAAFCMTVTAFALCFGSKMSLTANLFTWT